MSSIVPRPPSKFGNGQYLFFLWNILWDPHILISTNHSGNLGLSCFSLSVSRSNHHKVQSEAPTHLQFTIHFLHQIREINWNHRTTNYNNQCYRFSSLMWNRNFMLFLLQIERNQIIGAAVATYHASPYLSADPTTTRSNQKPQLTCNLQSISCESFSNDNAWHKIPLHGM